MASLAEKRKADAEEGSIDPQARPEELRLLEALLFASSEPLDQATLAKRMPEGVDIKVRPETAIPTRGPSAHSVAVRRAVSFAGRRAIVMRSSAVAWRASAMRPGEAISKGV